MSTMLLSVRSNDTSLNEIIQKLKNSFNKTVSIDEFEKANNIKQKLQLINVLLLYFYFQQQQRDIFNLARYIYGPALNHFLREKAEPVSDQELENYLQFLNSFKNYLDDLNSKCQEFNYPYEFIIDQKVVDKCIKSANFHKERVSIEEILNSEKEFFDDLFSWIKKLAINDVVCLYQCLEAQRIKYVNNLIINSLGKKRMKPELLNSELVKYRNILDKYKEISEIELDY